MPCWRDGAEIDADQDLSGVHTYDEAPSKSPKQSGVRTSPANPGCGVAVVYQDLSLVESLSVGANLIACREPRTRFGFLKKRQLMAEAGAFLRDHGIPLDRERPSVPCRSPIGR